MKRRSVLGLTTIVGLLLVAGTQDAPADDATPLAKKILKFAKNHVDQKVGNGACGVFVEHALQAAGAKTANDYKETHRPFKCPFCGETHAGGGGEYIFGKQVYKIENFGKGFKEMGSLAKVRPGDIAQFRHVKLLSQGYGHHSAIISNVNPQDKTINVYHQLGKVVGGEDKCGMTLSNLQYGWIRIYRPLPKK